MIIKMGHLSAEVGDLRVSFAQVSCGQATVLRTALVIINIINNNIIIISSSIIMIMI